MSQSRLASASSVVTAGAPLSSLTPTQQHLVSLFQRVRYGRFPRLPVQAGQPVLGPGLRWTRTVKVTGTNDPHPAIEASDFALRVEVARFLSLLIQIGDGEILNLEVRNGLPADFEVEESLAG